jgi:CSLREA domain-containing protein
MRALWGSAAALLLLAVLTSDASVAHGASFTVDSTIDAVDANPGDGICADSGGACTLRAAVMETNALDGADVIDLPSATYGLSIAGAGEDASATGDLDVNGTLSISSSLTNGPIPQPSSTINGGGLDRVVDVRGTLELTGVVVSGGSVSGDLAFGGGIRLDSGDLSLSHTLVHGNATSSFGGGLFVDSGGSATVSSSVVSENTATDGGGIFTVSDSHSTLQLTSVTQNAAVLDGGGIAHGGGANLIATNITVTDNSAGQRGGGIASFGTANLSGSTIKGNTSDGGAGIHSGGGPMTIAQTTIANNFGIGVNNAHGGINEPTPPVILQMTNTTITGNSVGISNQLTGAISAMNVTVAYNQGLGLVNDDGGSLSLGDSVIGQNTANCSGTISSSGHNLDTDGSCHLASAGDVFNTNARLGQLISNGGPTETLYPLPDSPAIDTGSNLTCQPTDQIGNARPIDGNFDGTPVCDMGAVEATYACACDPPPIALTATPRAIPNAGSDAASGPGWASLALGLGVLLVIMGMSVATASRRH